jgi:hypothetical protein
MASCQPTTADPIRWGTGDRPGHSGTASAIRLGDTYRRSSCLEPTPTALIDIQPFMPIRWSTIGTLRPTDFYL